MGPQKRGGATSSSRLVVRLGRGAAAGPDSTRRRPPELDPSEGRQAGARSPFLRPRGIHLCRRGAGQCEPPRDRPNESSSVAAPMGCRFSATQLGRLPEQVLAGLEGLVRGSADRCGRAVALAAVELQEPAREVVASRHDLKVDDEILEGARHTVFFLESALTAEVTRSPSARQHARSPSGACPCSLTPHPHPHGLS
jgi:hypothetical protein